MRWTHALALLLLGCGARSGLDSQRPAAEDAGVPCISNGAEDCDGVDDDCDGRVDEGVLPLECGPPGCRTVVRCEGGAFEECVPRVPTLEACNLEDDDCDGRVDEGLGIGPLGDVAVLRRDEFDTGPCTTCSWAFGTTVAPTDDGLLALWNIGLSGGREMPNVYGRRLDRRGRPLGPVERLRDDFILHMQPVVAIAPYPAPGLPLEASYRVGADDVFGLLFVDRAGGTRSVLPLSPSGPRNVQIMAWTGERFVAAWEQEGLRMASYSFDANDERAIDVSEIPFDLGSITLGVYRDRVGALIAVVREDREREQWLVVLAPNGDIRSLRRVPLEYRSWQRLVGIEAGWLYIDPGTREPSRWQVLSVEGEPLTELSPFPDARRLGDSGGSDHFLPRPDQRETLFVWQSPWGEPDADLHVEMLDAQGAVSRAWSGPLPTEPNPDAAYLGDPHVVAVDDHFVLVWHAGAPDSEPNGVYALELGCVP